MSEEKKENPKVVIEFLGVQSSEYTLVIDDRVTLNQLWAVIKQLDVMVAQTYQENRMRKFAEMAQAQHEIQNKIVTPEQVREQMKLQ